MSIIPISNLYSTQSYYVRTIITKLKKENKFWIEDCEEVIDIYNFFNELLNMVDKEREGRNK